MDLGRLPTLKKCLWIIIGLSLLMTLLVIVRLARGQPEIPVVGLLLETNADRIIRIGQLDSMSGPRYRRENIPPTATDFRSCLVYAIHSTTDQRFYLIAQGFSQLFPGSKLKEIKAESCMAGVRPLALIKQMGNVFECNGSNGSLAENDILSVRLKDGHVAPSVAEWSMRTVAENLTRPPPCKLCVITQIRNAGNDIADWIEYHTRQGVEQFIIYDNNSTDNINRILHQYPHTILIDWPWRKSQQQAFIHGILFSRSMCRWALFIDVDEYIFPKYESSSENIRVRDMVLLGHRKFKSAVWGDQMGVSQICFRSKEMGTSGWIKHPNMSVPEAYIHFYEWKRKTLTKCAIQPTQAHLFTTIHRFRVSGRTVFAPTKLIHVVHYSLQSWEHHLEKFDLGRNGLVNDWNIKVVNPNKPTKLWTTNIGVLDTEFRDYKRRVDTWPLNILPRTRCPRG